MKAIVALQLAVLVIGTVAFTTDDEWAVWKVKHGKTYKDDNEDLHRKNIWMKSKAFVKEHNKNAEKHGFTVTLNKFADLETAEFVQIYNGYRQDLLGKLRNNTKVHKPSGLKAPTSIDWRKQGIVTKVKNQGQCGSCWSFSATGSVEGQHAKNTGQLVSLSEQQLIDCSTSFGNHGCQGGLMDYAFRYLETEKDETEKDYPYLAENGVCRYDSSKGVVGVTGYTDVASEDEDALLDAVATVGPISVAMDASHMSFQLYHSGVYSEDQCSSTSLDHGVLAVGYGVATLTGEKYWLVKNSWGTDWGQSGYFELARDKDNMCGIATQASYPTGVN